MAYLEKRNALKIAIAGHPVCRITNINNFSGAGCGYAVPALVWFGEVDARWKSIVQRGRRIGGYAT